MRIKIDNLHNTACFKSHREAQQKAIYLSKGDLVNLSDHMNII